MERPNIVLITLHDLGKHLSCYGIPDVRSPNIDRLAEEGVRFNCNFATATYCSPSRGGMLTGKWPHVNGLMGLVNLGWDLPDANTTIAQALGPSGYETVLFGLQHETEDVNRLGFQRVADTESRRCADVAPVVADYVRNRSDDRPFYFRIGFSEVHRVGADYEPYRAADSIPANELEAVGVPPYLQSTPGARLDTAQLNACVEHTDREVGRILEAIDRSSYRDNTMVVFTTDHGIDFPGAKGTLYDPGINTTLIVRWPEAVPGGRSSSELISNIDLFPTILEAAQVAAPEDVNGRSFLSLLKNQPYEPNEVIFAEKNTSPFDTKRCVRTEKWKLIRNFDEGPRLLLGTCSEHSYTRLDMGDEHLAPRPLVELYDLSSDPNETENLAGRDTYQNIEKKLLETLHSWMVDTADPLLSGPVPRPPRETELREAAWANARRRAAEKQDL